MRVFEEGQGLIIVPFTDVSAHANEKGQETCLTLVIRWLRREAGSLLGIEFPGGHCSA